MKNSNKIMPVRLCAGQALNMQTYREGTVTLLKKGPHSFTVILDLFHRFNFNSVGIAGLAVYAPTGEHNPVS